MNTAQRILKNVASLLISRAIAQSFTFVSIIYLARILGPADFGRINFALAIVAYFTLIGNMGLPLLGTRDIARDKDKIRDYSGSVLTLRFFLAVLGFSLLLLMAFFLNKPLEIRYLIILYGLGLIPSALLLDWAFQGVEKMEYIGLGRILAAVIYVGLVLGFVKGRQQLLLIPCFHVAANLLAAGLLISIFVRQFGRPEFGFKIVFWKSLLRQALPIGFSLVMIEIFYNIDTVMLGFMRSDEEVGYYNAAYKIIMLLILASGAYHDAIFPVISNYYATSIDLLQSLLLQTAKLMVTLALPLAIGGTILARPLINFIYGAAYSGGVIALQILIWAVAIIWINTVYSRALLGCDRQNKYALAVAMAALINVILNFVLIPPLGLKGAAIATVLAEGIASVIYYVELRNITRVSFLTYIFRPLLASIVMGLFLRWGLNSFDMNLLSLISAGAFVYFAFLFLVRGVTGKDIESIRSTIIARR